MSKIIVVENLAKKYTLQHKGGQQYVALRDVLTSGVKHLGQRLLARGTSDRDAVTREDFWALREISFEVRQGDRVGIIGRNGAGKSTLLKILSRITEPTRGSVRIRGRVASLLEVGTGFHPELTGRENIYLNGAILGMTRAEIKKKFDEIVDFAEVEKFLDTPVKRYSSGMYVRLAFAVAAHLEPEILLVDEVLAVGDARFQKKCLGKMDDVGREGRTIFFVSHNLTAIRSHCTRGLLIKEGRLVADLSPEEAISSYVNDLRESTHHFAWTDVNSAPRNQSVIVTGMSLLSDDGAILDEVFTDTPINVAIDFTTRHHGVSAGFTLLVHDMENNLVFSSIGNHEEKWYGKAMPLGNYRTICRVPANLLNNGWFTVGFITFGKGFLDDVTANAVLRVEVLDGATVRGDYFGGYGGNLRPLLHWQTVLRQA